MAGYVLTRDGQLASQVGPLAADDDRIARALLARALAAAGGPVFLDLPERDTVMTDAAADAGFAPVRRFVRMARGVADPADRNRYRAVVGPEFG